MKNSIIILLCTLYSFISFAQISEYDEFIVQGKELLRQNRVALAKQKFQQAINIDSTKFYGNYGLGIAYYAFCKNEYNYCDSCVFYFTKALKIDSRVGNIHYFIGLCKFYMKDYENAISEFNISLETHVDTLGYMSRGLAKIALNRVDEACNDFQTAYKLGSENAKLYYYKNCLKN